MLCTLYIHTTVKVSIMCVFVEIQARMFEMVRLVPCMYVHMTYIHKVYICTYSVGQKLQNNYELKELMECNY